MDKTKPKGGHGMLYLLYGLGGIAIGGLLSWLIFRVKTVGTLMVITTHLEDKPYMCIDGLEVDPNDVKKMKRIAFRVQANNNSHK